MPVAVVDDDRLAKEIWRRDGRGLLRNLVVLLGFFEIRIRIAYLTTEVGAIME